MKILAIDTALSGCSAAFLDAESGISACETMRTERGQAEHLLPIISRVLAQAGQDYLAISRIVTTVGPGAFTGLRIGISAARALGMALSVPVEGRLTTDVMAAAFLKTMVLAPDERLCVLLETRRADFYAHLFGPQGTREGGYAPRSLPAADLAKELSGQKVVFIGDALTRFRAACPPEGGWRFDEDYTLPDPLCMAGLCARGEAGALPPEPVYLREADVSQSKKTQKIILEAGDLSGL